MSCNPITAALLRGIRVDESDDRVQQSFGLVAMRRVAAVVELEDPRPWQAPPDRAQLVERAMLVFASLHGQDRALDTRDLRFDVPCAKARVAADVVPSP